MHSQGVVHFHGVNLLCSHASPFSALKRVRLLAQYTRLALRGSFCLRKWYRIGCYAALKIYLTIHIITPARGLSFPFTTMPTKKVFTHTSSLQM